MTEDGKALRFEILRTDSLDIAMGGTTGNVINFPNLPLSKENGGEANDSMVAAYAAIHDKTSISPTPTRPSRLRFLRYPQASTSAPATARSPSSPCR
jgi:hypothetical protein